MKAEEEEELVLNDYLLFSVLSMVVPSSRYAFIPFDLTSIATFPRNEDGWGCVAKHSTQQQTLYKLQDEMRGRRFYMAYTVDTDKALTHRVILSFST